MTSTEMNTIVPGINDAYFGVALSFTLFICNNIWILPMLVPKSARTSQRQMWKWRNIANSFIHSFITGCGACIW